MCWGHQVISFWLHQLNPLSAATLPSPTDEQRVLTAAVVGTLWNWEALGYKHVVRQHSRKY